MKGQRKQGTIYSGDTEQTSIAQNEVSAEKRVKKKRPRAEGRMELNCGPP